MVKIAFIEVSPIPKGEQFFMETHTPQRPAGPSQNHAFAAPQSRRRPGPLGWVALALSTLILAGLIYVGVRLLTGSEIGPSAVKTSQFQAVFLTNGQVYFGKIKSQSKDSVNLTDIYYLQVQQQVQPEDKNKTAQTDQQLSLAKLGGELHGPEDSMYINRDQVLFWENLKDDGKVVQAIKNVKK